MATIGNEQYVPPNGSASWNESRTSSLRSDYSQPSGQTGASVQGSQTNQSAGQSTGKNVSEFTRISNKVKEIPYILPIAVGGAAFLLGVLATSRILRSAALLASGYVVKQAFAHAPKQEMVNYAKSLLINAMKQP